MVMMEGRPMMMMGQLMPLGLDGVGISYFRDFCLASMLYSASSKRLQLLLNMNNAGLIS